jgi:hypothetical protein
MPTRALKELVLSNPNPGGAAFPASTILIEPPHLRGDKSIPRDIMALGRDVHKLDVAMNIVIASGLTKSRLSSSCKSYDFVLKAAEKAKFRKDIRSVNPISSSSTMRFVPLALNYFGLRGPHFQAVLKEFAKILVTKPEGCSLLHGLFALTHSGALHKILRTGINPNMGCTKRAC